MAVPKFEDFIDPVFRLIGENAPIQRQSLRQEVIKRLNLSDADQREQVRSGRLAKWKDRTNWSVSYLKAAGLVIYLKRGVYGLTSEGEKVLKLGQKVDLELLRKFESFSNFVSGSGEEKMAPKASSNLSVPADKSPEESFYQTYDALREQTKEEILAKITTLEPDEFERLVVELMIALGYGTSLDLDAFVTGRSGDEGVDGIIHLDKLGLEKVYLQAKKWKDTNTVGRPEIQKFVGALEGKKAKKGVFITTSSFSKDANEYANAVKSEIALVDGNMLAGLMFDANLGVSVEREIQVKKIDSDYFDAL
jgi:restriction system protein